MDEYTPDTQEVQSRYMRWSNEHERRFYPKEDIEEMVERCNAEFDRWLAQHEEKIATSERKKIIEMLNSYREDLLYFAELQASNAGYKPAWYEIEQAQAVSECIFRVMKKVD